MIARREEQARQQLERLRTHVPDGCPLHVSRSARPYHFIVTGPGCEVQGRPQAVGAFIDGYVAGWRERTGADGGGL